MTENDQLSDQNNSEGDFNFCRQCHQCGSKMEKGVLNIGGDGITQIFIEAQANQEYIPLSVCFCRDCGNVRLFIEG